VHGNAIAKLFVRADPGALLASAESLQFVRRARNQVEVLVYGPHFVQEISPNAIGRALARWISSL
jgi:haloalkane dehalogenase